MTQQDRAHRRVPDPCHTDLGVHLGAEIAGEEAITGQAARSHQDEDPEGGVAEAESGRLGFGVEPDHQIQRLDVAVDLRQFGGGRVVTVSSRNVVTGAIRRARRKSL